MTSIADSAGDLGRLATRAFERIESALAGAGDAVAASKLRASRDARLDAALSASEFLCDWASSNARAFAGAVADGSFASAPDRAALARRLAAVTADAASDEDYGARLRIVRDEVQAGIVYRMCAGIDAFEATVTTCTDLAEVAIEQATAWLYPRQCEAQGTPIGSGSGERQALIVVALGKLGACELNLSSDIDLMFAFAESGETGTGTTNQAFMVRLAQRVVGVLGGRGPSRGAFRVDLRLRPFGLAGALALSFDALENYLVEHGRGWERFAFMRARSLTGALAARRALDALLTRFVFRGYVDYGAIEALREIRRRIVRERGGAADDIKIGAGGIRAVEFVVQALQLVHGGRDVRLRTPRLRDALSALVDVGALDVGAARALGLAYVHLRDVEHRLQAMRDEQTQRLPRDPLDLARLARGMGATDVAAFEVRLDRERALVERHFEVVISDGVAIGSDGGAFWPPGDGAAAALAALGYRDGDAAAAAMRSLVAARESMSAEAAARLDRFVPHFVRCAAPHGDRALHATLPVVEAVLRRSAYLALLNERSAALEELVALCGTSPMLADLLARHPALLDDLVDPRQWRRPHARATFDHEIGGLLARTPADDLEATMNALRTYKRSQVLAILAGAVRGALPLMRVSDALTWLAEALLIASLRAASAIDSDTLPLPLLIVGYGKLGGLELSPSSDLDIVLLHDAGAEASARLHRVLQRFVHLVTTTTNEGRLYDIDMRLRPSGRDGLAFVSIGEFARYQTEDAWTFEHQALLRARALTAPDDDAVDALAERFSDVRRRVLTQTRDRSALRRDVIAMRARMRTQVRTPARAGRQRMSPGSPRPAPTTATGAASTDAESASATREAIKLGSGGIVDIEFMVQYLALAGAHDFPALVDHTDNVRMLEAIARAGLLPAADAVALRDAYLGLREAQHRIDLGAPVDSRAIAATKTQVAALYAGLLPEALGEAGAS